MKRTEIINKLKQYFKPYELVGKRTHEKLGGDSWQVFDTDTLHCLLIMREGINKPFTINTWFNGGQYDERGFRSNVQFIPKDKTLRNRLYLSGHVMGKAFDFKVSGMESEDVRNWIEANADLFPCKVRLEWRKGGVPISWVHFDTKQIAGFPKVYKFNI
jgi:hypothetical protein